VVVVVWLNILCKSGSIISDENYVYKHSSFNKQQNFNKSIKIRKMMECIKNDARIFHKNGRKAPYVI